MGGGGEFPISKIAKDRGDSSKAGAHVLHAIYSGLLFNTVRSFKHYCKEQMSPTSSTRTKKTRVNLLINAINMNMIVPVLLKAMVFNHQSTDLSWSTGVKSLNCPKL